MCWTFLQRSFKCTIKSSSLTQGKAWTVLMIFPMPPNDMWTCWAISRIVFPCWWKSMTSSSFSFLFSRTCIKFIGEPLLIAFSIRYHMLLLEYQLFQIVFICFFVSIVLTCLCLRGTMWYWSINLQSLCKTWHGYSCFIDVAQRQVAFFLSYLILAWTSIQCLLASRYSLLFLSVIWCYISI